MLDKTKHYNDLLDWYAPLLTDHQKSIAFMHFREDYSLSEIAEHTQSSRSAVHETLKRVELLLEEYEDKLRLYQKFTQRLKAYQALEAMHLDPINTILKILNDLE